MNAAAPPYRRILPWIVAVLVLNEAGFMAFDGARALVVGDYITPSTGEYAGQLGPWHHLVSAIGVPPRSTLMKLVFVVFGTTWLGVLPLYLRGHRLGVRLVAGYAAASSWYLVIGTVNAVVVLALLGVDARRQRAKP